MAVIEDVLKVLKKDHGDSVALKGDEVIDFNRVPFGVFPFDLAIGGGVPEGKISMIVGKESSGKTTLALLWVAEYQRSNPDKVVVWVDAEWSYDSQWAKALGVAVDKLVVVRPESGEMVVDFVEGALGADDLGVLVVDSVAAMVPMAELAGDAGRMQVGGNSLLVGKFCRKMLMSLGVANKEEKYPTVLLVNQIRFKIGVMFGNPESFPGGQTLKHVCNMIIRLYGVDEIVGEHNKKIPVLKKITMTLNKYKCPILSKTSEFRMVIVPHADKPVGYVEYWNTVIAYAKDLGYIVKVGKKWVFNEVEYPTLLAIQKYLKGSPNLLADLKVKLIADARNNLFTL